MGGRAKGHANWKTIEAGPREFVTIGNSTLLGASLASPCSPRAKIGLSADSWMG
jgi:hypothetical protein